MGSEMCIRDRARGPKRPTKPKVEDQTLRRLGVSNLQTQCKRKGRNPYTTKLTPTSVGLRLASQRYGSQKGSHLCTRPCVAAKTDDRVLQQGAARVTPVCFCAPHTIVRHESASGLEHGLTIRRTRSYPSLFPCSFVAGFNFERNPFRISRVMLADQNPSGHASFPAQLTPGQDIVCVMLVPRKQRE